MTHPCDTPAEASWCARARSQPRCQSEPTGRYIGRKEPAEARCMQAAFCSDRRSARGYAGGDGSSDDLQVHNGRRHRLPGHALHWHRRRRQIAQAVFGCRRRRPIREARSRFAPMAPSCAPRWTLWQTPSTRAVHRRTDESDDASPRHMVARHSGQGSASETVDRCGASAVPRRGHGEHAAPGLPARLSVPPKALGSGSRPDETGTAPE